MIKYKQYNTHHLYVQLTQMAGTTVIVCVELNPQKTFNNSWMMQLHTILKFDSFVALLDPMADPG